MLKPCMAILCFTLTALLHAGICPDPETSSLKWGVVPPPWEQDPFSSRPQGEAGTEFIQANIIRVGIGRGVVCHYHNSLGLYSIWWQTQVKLPARTDYEWIETQGGYLCRQSREKCSFNN